MEDEKILELYFARSETAISESISKYGNYCGYICENILRSKEDAQECVNDVFLNAWRSIPPHCPQNLKTYLGKIARNLAIKKLEKKQAQKRGGGQIDLILSELEDCVAASSSVEDSIDNAAFVECINSFLLSLPAQKRIIFVRRYWYAGSISDIAEQYNMSKGKVKSLLSRLRGQLKKHLENGGFSV